MTLNLRSIATALLCGALLVHTAALPARGQGAQPLAPTAPSAQSPLLRAAGDDELPLPAWGPYARAYVGPCCMVNRALQQQFAFPIVIGQQREETVLRRERGANGKQRVVLGRTILLRRSTGLAPIRAAEDDVPPPGAADSRQAYVVEANREGTFWRAHTVFAPAGLAQKTAQDFDAGGQPIPPPDWGAGEANVECFPAFADPAGDGLLIRVAITNRSDRAQTWFVDLLGGMDTHTERFAHQDLVIESAPQDNALVLRHPQSAAMFALAASPIPYALRRYRVNSDYFGPAGAQANRDADDVPTPTGVSSLDPAPGRDDSSWALLRLSGILTSPGQTVTLLLSIGVGSTPDSASASAQTLLAISEDSMPGSQLREGAYTKALHAHEQQRYAPADDPAGRLMAQSLANVPLTDGRRLGVASRRQIGSQSPGAYDAVSGGMIALAWADYEPLLAAAQLSAHYRTRAASATLPRALSLTNLFALWELFQKTQDVKILAYFYPFAQRDYHDLLGGGSGQTTPAGWPTGFHDDVFAPDAPAIAAAPPTLSPDFAAYVIRAAKLLREMAWLTNRPDSEVQGYEADAKRMAARAFAPSGVPNLQTVSSLLPLIAGADALPADLRAVLLKALDDPTEFRCSAGIRQVSKTAGDYHADDPRRGAVRIGMNWLLWKALIDLGEAQAARHLASDLMRSYQAALHADGGCPEWLNGDTGAPGGADDYAGDACGLIPLYAAYHLPGNVAMGWQIMLLDRRFDPSADTLHIAFRNMDQGRAATLLCVMGKPGGRYTLSGALTGEVQADEDGVLTLNTPKDNTTQGLDITPAMSAK